MLETKTCVLQCSMKALVIDFSIILFQLRFFSKCSLFGPANYTKNEINIMTRPEKCQIEMKSKVFKIPGSPYNPATKRLLILSTLLTPSPFHYSSNIGKACLQLSANPQISNLRSSEVYLEQCFPTRAHWAISIFVVQN